MLESLQLIKKNLTQVLYCCEFFKNIYFEEHLRTVASDLTLKVIVWNFVSEQSLSKPS